MDAAEALKQHQTALGILKRLVRRMGRTRTYRLPFILAVLEPTDGKVGSVKVVALNLNTPAGGVVMDALQRALAKHQGGNNGAA